jgi:hypothetical protein
MTDDTPRSPVLAHDILNRVENVIRAAEQAVRPVEVDPYRGQLFELFVMADAAGYTQPESPVDLSSDGVCHALAERWGLADAARDSFTSQTKLPPDQLARMRSLWSVMRMWMEWEYAWSRWAEFHGGAGEPAL